MPAGTLQLPWLKFSCAFSSVVWRQMPGYNLQRRGTARTVPKVFVLFYVLFVLCHSVCCLCVIVYCTTATWWQPNCSLTNISYHISYLTVDSMMYEKAWIFHQPCLWKTCISHTVLLLTVNSSDVLTYNQHSGP